MNQMSEHKPWLRRYMAGTPAEIGALPHATIPALVKAAVAEYRDRPAFESFGVRLTFAEIDRRSRDFAAYLQADLGLRKGERVAVMMPNILQYPIALFGILRAGLIVVSVNPLYTARELEHQLRDSGAAAIVIFESAAQRLQQALPGTSVRHVVIASLGDLLGLTKGTLLNFVFRTVKKMVPAYSLPNAVKFNAALAAGARKTLSEPELASGDVAFLQYTGGTTGIAKGAMLTHSNLLSNVEQLALHFGTGLQRGEEVAIAPLPLYHILALVINGLLYLRAGALQVLVANPRDIDRLVKTLASTPFTFFLGVNTLFNALLNHPEFGKIDFSSLRYCGGGGAPIQVAVAKRWQEVTGRPLIEGYGLTETAGAVSRQSPGSLRA